MNENLNKSDQRSDVESEENIASTSKRRLIKKISVISISALAILGFAGNVIYAVFSGGEFTQKEQQVVKTAGLLRVEEAKYVSSYFSGEQFSFDKEKSKVSLVAKDKAIPELVKIDDLPSGEYGFMASHYEDENGNKVLKEIVDKENSIDPKEDSSIGEDTDSTVLEKKEKYTEVFEEYHKDPSEITMDAFMNEIYVVSDMYQDLKSPLSIQVIDGIIEESKLTDNITFEAEQANIYKDGILLSEEELGSMPDTQKPFLSNKGESPLEPSVSEKLSGGACLRNFQSYNMKLDFTIVTSQACESLLTIQYCNRKESKKFGSYFKVLVNGDAYEEIDEQSTIKGTDFFTPRQLAPVKIQLNKGLNHISFESGTDVSRLNPVNLDAIFLKTEAKSIGTMDAVVLKDAE